jgi:sugar O-acyltransferase (sialic acid O-acetyltransferase NeuD family)
MSDDVGTHSTALVVVGAGGFGREVVDLVRDARAAGAGIDLLGVVDDVAPDPALLDVSRVAHVGTVEQVARAHPGCSYVVAVGDPATRRSLAGRARAAGLVPAILVHPSASLGPSARLGAGTIVCASSVITTNVVLGSHCLVNLACTIGHDARLGDGVSLMPGVHLSGGVVLEDDVYIGTGAVVLPGVRIGEAAVVGAGACVVHDVAPGTTVVGVPARPVGAPSPSDGAR